VTFASLGLCAALLQAVEDFEAPTDVQSLAIPPSLRGEDVLASAPTGSGKTAAFVLPILHALAEDPRERPLVVRAVILAPTRELAAQIADVAQRLSRFFPDRPETQLAIGGVSINPQMMALRGGADVVVATPGRLLDLVEHNALRLGGVRTLVLDEADRMLSLGFAEELARIVALLPARRQNLLFSATLPPAVRRLAAGLLRDPAQVVVEATAPELGEGLSHRALDVDTAHRTRLLLRLLDVQGWSHVLVFVASRHGAEHLATKLRKAGIAAAALHGELAQGTRAKALADLAAKRVRVLVATDVAARGLDIPELPAVVSYDLPRSTADYLHRAGRTARAGAKGESVSFVTAADQAHFRLIEKRHHLVVDHERVEGLEPTEVAPARDPNGGVKGARKSKKDRLREAAARAASEGR
jgi:ATP-dependent RNA helicase RhlE